MSQLTSVTSGSPLSVLVNAVWLVMKKRDIKNFGKILDFLELTHEQVPGLLYYTHHAKLSTGLRGKIVLHMFEEKKPLLDILTALNCYFPPVFPDDSAVAHRKAFKVQQCKIHFRKLVLRMIRDENFRQHFVENTLHVEYGDTFMAVLEKLLWEFLCRLETVLNYQVPGATEPSVVDEDHLSNTPIRPSAGLNFSEMKKQRSNATTCSVTSSDKPEETPSSVYRCTQSEQGSGRCKGTALQAEGVEQEPVYRRTLDLVSSFADGGYRMDEPHPPFLSIFGFDCSESTRINPCENFSPPDPLQSPDPDVDLGHGSESVTWYDEMGHGSFSDIQVTDVAQTLNPHPVSSSLHAVSEVKCDRQDEALAQGLMSWRFQPRVCLTKLPLNIINKYQDQESSKDKTSEENVTSQMADSELSQSETLPPSGSWSWVHSGPTDNDSNDPDYLPGHTFFHHVVQQISRIQPKRPLHSLHHHDGS
ncbi:TERF1-interacting nuclear factor 2 [Dendropsophus ebraccatus]|uniref:TERF1-interacting nuclear factor 2 n=1 Tax=Dendropsophus ebraccatus TaxID=150705 RepID=UPI003831BE0B